MFSIAPTSHRSMQHPLLLVLQPLRSWWLRTHSILLQPMGRRTYSFDVTRRRAISGNTSRLHSRRELPNPGVVLYKRSNAKEGEHRVRSYIMYIQQILRGIWSNLMLGFCFTRMILWFTSVVEIDVLGRRNWCTRWNYWWRIWVGSN